MKVRRAMKVVERGYKNHRSRRETEEDVDIITTYIDG